jgi:3-deoxy-manno-octulosonate cytidylyltransferase (CMP-KDO synthetase)
MGLATRIRGPQSTNLSESIMSDLLVIIPARMAASRLPGKPLADIAGKPMVLQVFERAREANVGPVLIATDDVRILDFIKAAGGEAVMTDPNLPSGSDRTYAAAEIFDPEGRFKRIINLQGDLPFIDPQSISAAAKLLDDPLVDIATPGAPFDDIEAKLTDSVVKIAGVEIAPKRLRAHYFSRAPIPYGDGKHIHHVGLYAFQREALKRFVSAPPSPLEISERLEQLRALDMGMRIDVALVDTVPMSVDTPEDLEKVRAYAASLKA